MSAFGPKAEIPRDGKQSFTLLGTRILECVAPTDVELCQASRCEHPKLTSDVLSRIDAIVGTNAE